MDKDAKAIADWVVRVMSEAEALPVATQLWIREAAYVEAFSGTPKRLILTQLCNEIFMITDVPEVGTRSDMLLEKVAGQHRV